MISFMMESFMLVLHMVGAQVRRWDRERVVGGGMVGSMVRPVVHWFVVVRLVVGVDVVIGVAVVVAIRYHMEGWGRERRSARPEAVEVVAVGTEVSEGTGHH